LGASDHTPASSLLALDFGMRRIGVASATPLTGTATPLATVPARDGEPEWAQLDKLIHEWQPALLVLGLPCNSDLSESDMTAHVRAFASRLQERYALEVKFMDERYTSAEAESRLKEQRQSGIRNKRIKKADVDSLAAAIIAESWMRNTNKKSDETS
jgi:putative Holliday junction resolvase